MGTDIYLSYEGITEEEKNKVQIRASIWMKKQNWFLRKIFPCFWHNEGFEEFDFKANGENFELLLVDYMEDRIDQINSVADEEAQEDMNEVDTIVAELVATFADSPGRLQKGTTKLTEEQEQDFLIAVLNFYKKGLKLQKEGLKPKILISW